MLSKFVNVHYKWGLAILFVLNLVVISAVVGVLKNRYDWASHSAEIRAQNFALAVDLHLSSEISKIDLSLNTVVSELGHFPYRENGVQTQIIRTLLKDQKALLPETEGLDISDASGRIIFSGSGNEHSPFSVANRDYFRDLQSGRVDGLIVSSRLTSLRTENNVIIFARPYRDNEGIFSGIVIAPLPVSYFDQVLGGFELGPRGVLVIRDAKLGFISRILSGVKKPSVPPGNPRLSKELQSILATGTSQATYRAVTPTDQIDRIYSYRRLQSVPIHILAGIATEDFLKDWRTAVWGSVGFLALFLFIANASAVLLYRQWRRQLRDAASLQESNVCLTQLLKDISERDKALVAAQEAGKLGTYSYHIPSGTSIHHAQLDSIFGIDASYPHTTEGWAQLIHPDDLARVQGYFKKTITQRQVFDREYRVVRHVDREVIWVHDLGKLELDDDGHPLSINGVVQDISVRKFAEERMHLAQEVFLNATDAVIVTDREGMILETNPAFEVITGYSSEEARGQDVKMLRSGTYDDDVYTRIKAHLLQNGYWEGELTGRRKDGKLYAQHSRISAIRNDQSEIVRFAAVISDITELRESQQRLEHLAYYDELTKLPNRTLLADRMRQAMATCLRADHHRLAICYLDLDGFKEINDRWGQDLGNQLLVEVSKRLQNCVRANDTVARLGGDEFVVILCDLKDEQEVMDSASRLLKIAGRPYQIGTLDVRVTLSAGVTLYPSSTTDEADVLLRQADQAMYQAKRNGKNCMSFFDLESELSLREYQTKIDRLTDALKRGEFRLVYQPKVSLRSGELTGVEALIRWQHPERGLLPPSEFLAIIETSALTLPVGEWIIHEVLQQQRKWLEHGIDIKVAINIFGLHLQRPNFVERLEYILRNYPEINPQSIEFEVVETTALENLEEVNARILGCNKLGVGFSLDDFGTGYSSLTYLRELTVDTVKIDRSFVRDMLFNEEDRALVESIVAMAHALGRKVVAEGVETIEHGAPLIRCGCDFVQGYGIARPMLPEDLPHWIAQWRMPKTWSDAMANEIIYFGAQSR